MAMKPEGKPSHYWFRKVEDMAGSVETLEAKGFTVYHACCTFTEKTRRTADNALLARAFWMDLDVGNDPRKFPSKEVAAKELAAFVTKVKLPAPSYLIDSGGGLHAYWVLDADLEIARWRRYAEMLKALAAHHGFKCDPVRTADAASVLRPVGSHNYKFEPPRQVTTIFSKRVYPAADIISVLGDAEALIERRPARTSVSRTSVNADFAVKSDFPPANAQQIATQCAQVREMRDMRGCVPEPQWYGVLQVLAFCRNGTKYAHEWSSGYECYRVEEVNERMARVKDMGPTLCKTFEGRNPEACLKCPQRGHISTPVQLGQGTTVETAAEVEVDTEGEEDDQTEQLVRPEMPDEYQRKGDGSIWYTPKEPSDKNVTCMVSPFDVYAKELSFDPVQHCEVAIVECTFPNAGTTQIVVPTHRISSAKELESELRKNHVKVQNAFRMRDYLARQVTKIERIKQRRNFYSAFGWKDGTNQFVLGDQVYFIDGHVEEASLAEVLKPMAKAIKPRGDLATWANATRHLNGPDMAPYAFMFAASIAAPLIKFTGYEGLLINAVGRSNSGKTSMGRFGVSAFGNFDELRMKQRDTGNAKIQRLAHLGALPGYVDEITNEDPERMSDFVYEVTQGRSKLRLRQDGVERPTYEWNTLVVSSSNTSVHSKLGLAKANPEAERLRVFEFSLERSTAFTQEAAGEIWRVSNANYGLVGPRLIEYVMANQARIKDEIDHVAAKLTDVANMQASERMWLAGVSTVIYTLILLKRLGVSMIEPSHVIRWLVTEIRGLRESMSEVHFSAIDLLGAYINDHSSGRLTIREDKATRAGAPPDYVVERYPTREMVMRYEATTGRMFIDASHYRKWLATKHESMQRHLNELQAMGVYKASGRKNLGAYTSFSGVTVRALVMDMTKDDAAGVMRIVAGNDVGHEQRRMEAHDAANG